MPVRAIERHRCCWTSRARETAVLVGEHPQDGLAQCILAETKTAIGCQRDSSLAPGWQSCFWPALPRNHRASRRACPSSELVAPYDDIVRAIDEDTSMNPMEGLRAAMAAVDGYYK